METGVKARDWLGEVIFSTNEEVLQGRGASPATVVLLGNHEQEGRGKALMSKCKCRSLVAAVAWWPGSSRQVRVVPTYRKAKNQVPSLLTFLYPSNPCGSVPPLVKYP